MGFLHAVCIVLGLDEPERADSRALVKRLNVSPMGRNIDGDAMDKEQMMVLNIPFSTQFSFQKYRFKVR